MTKQFPHIEPTPESTVAVDEPAAAAYAPISVARRQPEPSAPHTEST